MLDFYGRLITSGWICFAAEPMKANHTLVEKFYANVFETSFNGEWLVDKLYGGGLLQTEELIHMNRAVLIAAIMDDMGIDVGRLIVDQIFELAPGRAKSIIFPSLITRFFYEAGVVKHPTDE
ncbi:hypothetical protein KY289_001657 [Solanum tuberosum]|nr:hypothetical protein KY289_001657 [Solanum tuberosum]